ncbi:MAG: isoleucine--tRNA ligase [Pyrinomonadaceae bacterium]|nr:isoleucine--tRNA ligase [Pyrinomonadaceae bacterium]MCX7640544.1 isoleucine--tRNA ligase [Pyrinomonadaceae bacterium]MDW8303875.1 isoleucine--tRNA ligase [Acidobacteriota bacterium]
MEGKLDLKKTINLPKTNFSQKANLTQSEPLRLLAWKEKRLYEKILQSREKAPKFILHDGPPYANADIHIGTALNKILKDFVIKSRTMMGFQAPFVPGYDCHGLPIENYVERKLKEKGIDKSQIPTEEFRKVCREHASTAMNNQTRDFQRLGVLGEWENPYLTMSAEYEAETARLFGRFVERGYVYRGLRPVYWDVYDQTALAEAEVEYKEIVSPSIYVKFPLKSDPRLIDEKLANKNVFLVIWTTTAWTLPANLGISVNPNFDYSAVEVGGEVYVIATELVNEVAEKCGFSENYRELARFKGEKLDRLECKHPWLDRTSLVMCGEHVTLGENSPDESEQKSLKSAGTGLVHTAPGHGTDDFYIAQKYGLPIYCPVDNAGRFTSDVEHFAGEFVFKANAKIVEFLRERSALLHAEEYRHRYPHGWRSHKPVIFRATPQWFISMDKGGETSLRSQALREIPKVKWYPSWGENRMANVIRQRPDWCISRQRVWGVPIIAFYCKNCENTILDPEIIYHVANIFAAETADAWYNRTAKELLPENFKCPKCNGEDFSKETDILDVWFDSGSSCIAVLETRNDTLRFPADLYLEGGDQYRGWFNSSLICAIAAHDTAPYRQVVTHGWVVDGEGKKMSKSLGNVVSPNEVVKKSGAEILRLWAAAVDYTEDVRCSNEILERVVDTYRKLRNTLRFALGNLYDFDPEKDSVTDLMEIDRWALAKLSEVTSKVLKSYEDYDFQAVYHNLYNYCTVTLSAEYFDILKDRLYTSAPYSKARRSAQTALYRIAKDLCRLLAPILAFTADEAWENLPGKHEESVHLAFFPKASLSAEEAALLERWKKIFEIRDLVLKSLEEARINKLIGSSLEAKVLLSVEKPIYEFLQAYKDELRYVFIVSQVELIEADNFSIEVKKADGLKCERCWNYSVRVGEFAQYPTVCERCFDALSQIEKSMVV